MCFQHEEILRLRLRMTPSRVTFFRGKLSREHFSGESFQGNSFQGKAFRETLLRLHDQFHQVDCQAGCQGNGCKGTFPEGQNDRYQKACRGGPDRAGCRENGRYGHGGQYSVRDIVQEGTDETVSDPVAYGNKGQHTDQIGGACHDRKIDEERGCRHERTSLPELCASVKTDAFFCLIASVREAADEFSLGEPSEWVHFGATDVFIPDSREPSE